jgi:hypothetical protein
MVIFILKKYFKSLLENGHVSVVWLLQYGLLKMPRATPANKAVIRVR